MTMPTKQNADDRARADGYVDAQGRREFAIVALSSLLFSITTTHSTLVAVALGHVGYSLQTIGVLISAVGVTALAATLGSGFVAARLGAVGAFRLAMALAAVGVASLAFTRAMFWPALASRLVWGAGVGLSRARQPLHSKPHQQDPFCLSRHGLLIDHSARARRRPAGR